MEADNDSSIATKKYAGKKDIISKKDSANYKTIFIANSILSFADGLYGPFLIGFLHGFGGIPLLGAGLGLILIFNSIGSYFAGKLADKYGRKPFFLVISVLSIAIFIAYPLLPLLQEIDHRIMLFALFLIFVVDGIADGAWGTVEAVYLADITSRVSRGSKMGSYWGVGGIITGAAMIGAGFLGLHIDFLTVAIIVAFIYLSGILILLRIKEM
jgi:MFS family permease